jgi:hypothetical protein
VVRHLGSGRLLLLGIRTHNDLPIVLGPIEYRPRVTVKIADELWVGRGATAISQSLAVLAINDDYPAALGALRWDCFARFGT